MFDIFKILKYSSFKFETISGIKHVRINTRNIKFFSKDLNAYEKYTLKNPNNKKWYHAICSTQQKNDTDGKQNYKPVWEIIPETEPDLNNWAKISEGSRTIQFNEEFQSNIKVIDQTAEEGDCYIQVSFAEYYRAIVKQPKTVSRRNCLKLEFASIMVTWPRPITCLTKKEMEIANKKAADLQANRRSIYG